MEILLLTVYLSLLLGALFLVLFLWDRRRANFSSPEQQSLRPLSSEKPVKSKKT